MNDRRNPQLQDALSFGPFSLFAAERLLKKGDEPVPLGGRALDILIALAERAGGWVAQARADLSIADAQLHRIQLMAPAAIYMPFLYDARSECLEFICGSDLPE